jgi:hypothetical protein
MLHVALIELKTNGGLVGFAPQEHASVYRLYVERPGAIFLRGLPDW